MTLRHLEPFLCFGLEAFFNGCRKWTIFFLERMLKKLNSCKSCVPTRIKFIRLKYLLKSGYLSFSQKKSVTHYRVYKYNVLSEWRTCVLEI
jgi:hypothetical protein